MSADDLVGAEAVNSGYEDLAVSDAAIPVDDGDFVEKVVQLKDALCHFSVLVHDFVRLPCQKIFYWSKLILLLSAFDGKKRLNFRFLPVGFIAADLIICSRTFIVINCKEQREGALKQSALRRGKEEER